MVNSVINPAAAANAYDAIQKGAMSNPAAGSAPVGKASFGDMLEDVARSSISTIRAGEQASAGGVTGAVDPLAITQAVSAARLTLDTVVAVRDAAVDAYNKIQGMPI